MNRGIENRLRRLEATHRGGRARVVTIYSGTREEAAAEWARLKVAGEASPGDVVITLTGYPGPVRSNVDRVDMAAVHAVDGTAPGIPSVVRPDSRSLMIQCPWRRLI
jgi:hypothetical protein